MDCTQAIMWIYSKGYRKIGVIGYSYGSYLALMSVLYLEEKYKDIIHFLVLDGSISDVDEFCKNGCGFLPTFFRKKFGYERRKYKKYSPLTYISRIGSFPILIRHGRKDIRIPFSQSEKLVDALQDIKKNVTFLRICGGHTWMTSRNEIKFYQKIDTIISCGENL